MGIDLFLQQRDCENDTDDDASHGTQTSCIERSHVVVLVDNIHDVLRDDKSAFATMLRTIRSAHGSNTQLSSARKTCVVVTLDRKQLDHRLYLQMQRESHTPRFVQVEHPAPQETFAFLTASLPALSPELARDLKRCTEEASGAVRRSLRLFQDRVEQRKMTVSLFSDPRRPPSSTFSTLTLPAAAARDVASAKAALGMFTGMCRAHADDEGRPDALWQDMSDAMAHQIWVCEKLLFDSKATAVSSAPSNKKEKKKKNEPNELLREQQTAQAT